MGEVHRLTDKELQDKQAKGLCYHCDNKWSAVHRCRKRELSVILMEDEDVEGFEERGSEPLPSPTEETIVEVPLHFKYP